jgi:cyclophilin family peptidyl-prolyl cis-trans isomerase
MRALAVTGMVLCAVAVAAAAQRGGGPAGFFTTTLPLEELQNRQVVLETSAGTIVVDLLPGAAPVHVSHFVTRVREGAYDGTLFHRVIPMGIIQGGDPLSRDPAQAARYGTGGLGVLRFEANDEPHTRGAVSAVLVPGDRDSAGLQFFIAVTDQPALDGQYTVFGRVAEGLGVVERISTTPADGEVPRERIAIVSATVRDRPPPAPEAFSTESVDELARMRARVETSLGAMTLELFPDRAPAHVRQFLRLAGAGVYDGTTIHRVIPGFVAQGGFIGTRSEPLDERQQALVRSLPPEFTDTPHERAILSMARGDEPDSATTSFFIVLAPAPSLDGQYSVFGRVIDGLEVLEAIEQAPLAGEAPVTPITVTRVAVVPPGN